MSDLIQPFLPGMLADRVEFWRGRLALLTRPIGTIDFEGRSACSLNKHGSWPYSEHPTTEAMCLAYKLPGADDPALWHMAHPQHLIDESPPPLELFAFILAGGLVEAHNSFFERGMWLNVMVARHGWPKVPHLQWRCSAAKASASSLPRALEDAAIAMRLTQEKDAEGRKLMLKMCKPRKPRKAERQLWKAEHGKEPMPILWHEEEEDIYRLWEYCKQDVRTEESLSLATRDLSPRELRVWQMDQALNERGLMFDLDLAEAALDVAKLWKARLNAELEAMTEIKSGTQRAAIKDWLSEHEALRLPDTKADTLEWIIKHDTRLTARAERVLQIMMEVNRTSTRKYQAMLDRASADWRIRDLAMYCGAGTGRWAGKGVQIHNFPARNLIVKDFDEAAEIIKTRDIDWIVAMYGDVMKLLSHALRGAIIAPPGKDLIVADYAAIEARCVLWLAGATEALKIFDAGGDIYCDMASGIYGYRVQKATHLMERQFGKQAILGLGYGMGFVTFLLTCRRYNIHFSEEDVLRIMGKKAFLKYSAWVVKYLNLDTYIGETLDSKGRRQAARVRKRLTDARENPDEIVHELALMKYTVDIYRSRYGEVKQLWKDQEAVAIQAVMFGKRVECGKVAWFVEDSFLRCELPSGRLMSYRDPEIKLVMTSWGEERPALRYMHVNSVTKLWERTATYGGKLVENITQAVARDMLADAMLLADDGDTYVPVLHVHDELACEVDPNKGSIEEFEGLMSSILPWAKGCPITAEAERYKRYRK